MGDALDLGTCKAKKKSGQPCTQTVNLVGFGVIRWFLLKKGAGGNGWKAQSGSRQPGATCSA